MPAGQREVEQQLGGHFRSCPGYLGSSVHVWAWTLWMSMACRLRALGVRDLPETTDRPHPGANGLSGLEKGVLTTSRVLPVGPAGWRILVGPPEVYSGAAVRRCGPAAARLGRVGMPSGPRRATLRPAG